MDSGDGVLPPARSLSGPLGECPLVPNAICVLSDLLAALYRVEQHRLCFRAADGQINATRTLGHLPLSFPFAPAGVLAMARDISCARFGGPATVALPSRSYSGRSVWPSLQDREGK